MLNTPARNAIATANPVRTSGVARTSVPDAKAYQEPTEPLQSAAAARNGSYRRTPRKSASAPTNAAATIAARVARIHRGVGLTSPAARIETPPSVESTRCQRPDPARERERPTAIRRHRPAAAPVGLKPW